MKIGSLVRIKRITNSGIHSSAQQWYLNKLAIVVVNGTWSIDVCVIENGTNPRIAKEDCEVLCE